MVRPNWRCRRFSSARMSWRSLASRLVSGSSSSRILRAADQGAAQRHALLLAARKRAGLAVDLRVEPEHRRRLLHAAIDLLARPTFLRPADRRSSRRRSDADRARRTGTPSTRRGPQSARGSNPCRRSRRGPRSGVTRPAMVRSVVVLPTELGPNSTKKRPSATLKDRFSSARTRPYDLLTFVKRSADFSDCPIAISQTASAVEDAYSPPARTRRPQDGLDHLRFGASEPHNLFSSVHRNIYRHRGRLNRTLTAGDRESVQYERASLLRRPRGPQPRRPPVWLRAHREPLR